MTGNSPDVVAHSFLYFINFLVFVFEVEFRVYLNLLNSSFSILCYVVEMLVRLWDNFILNFLTSMTLNTFITFHKIPLVRKRGIINYIKNFSNTSELSSILWTFLLDWSNKNVEFLDNIIFKSLHGGYIN